MTGALPRPGLLYLVDRNATGWLVLCESQQYGPYATLGSAMRAAVAEAEAASRAGFDSVVLMRDHDRIFTSCWTSGGHDGPAATHDGPLHRNGLNVWPPRGRWLL